MSSVLVPESAKSAAHLNPRFEHRISEFNWEAPEQLDVATSRDQWGGFPVTTQNAGQNLRIVCAKARAGVARCVRGHMPEGPERKQRGEARGLEIGDSDSHVLQSLVSELKALLLGYCAPGLSQGVFHVPDQTLMPVVEDGDSIGGQASEQKLGIGPSPRHLRKLLRWEGESRKTDANPDSGGLGVRLATVFQCLGELRQKVNRYDQAAKGLEHGARRHAGERITSTCEQVGLSNGEKAMQYQGPGDTVPKTPKKPKNPKRWIYRAIVAGVAAGVYAVAKAWGWV